MDFELAATLTVNAEGFRQGLENAEQQTEQFRQKMEAASKATPLPELTDADTKQIVDDLRKQNEATQLTAKSIRESSAAAFEQSKATDSASTSFHGYGRALGVVGSDLSAWNKGVGSAVTSMGRLINQTKINTDSFSAFGSSIRSSINSSGGFIVAISAIGESVKSIIADMQEFKKLQDEAWQGADEEARKTTEAFAEQAKIKRDLGDKEINEGNDKAARLKMIRDKATEESKATIELMIAFQLNKEKGLQDRLNIARAQDRKERVKDLEKQIQDSKDALQTQVDDLVEAEKQKAKVREEARKEEAKARQESQKKYDEIGADYQKLIEELMATQDKFSNAP